MTAALEVSDIEFGYRGVQVLFGISMAVQPGERLALVGTNGAGKSTLLRVASGLNAPSSGRVLLHGQDVTGVPAERLVERGLVLVQGGKGVFPDMTVKENVELAAPDRAALRERKEGLLEAFPSLAESWTRQARILSGGQQQQLALAKALLREPTVLCIDELSLGLAPVTVKVLVEVVTGIAQRGTTLVLVEQSLNIAAALCQRAVFLEKGEVRFEGAVADLLERKDIARAVFFGEAPAPTKRRRASA
jgi:ABC-type branched-subunit amino acid transport system ATPase component